MQYQSEVSVLSGMGIMSMRLWVHTNSLGWDCEDDPMGVSTVEEETSGDEIKGAHIFMGWNI